MPTYPLTMPSSPGFTDFDVELNHNVVRGVSDLNQSVQTTQLSGGHFVFSWSLPPMKEDQARAWIAFLAQLRSGYGTFYAGDPFLQAPRGTAPGTPLIKGASQTGTSVTTDGWTATQTGVLLPGDWIGIGAGATRELKMVTEQVNSDGTGNATIPFEPAIRTSPADNSAIVTSAPLGVFRPMSSVAQMSIRTIGLYGIAFSAREAF